MKLRIISGTFRGRFIQLSKKDSDIRPTLERTRQSVAEIIKNRIEDAVVADLCAGSGAFGFEMLSRGASRVDFVEKDRFRVEAIRNNARVFGIEDRCRVINKDMGTFVKTAGEMYDIVFYDPPYEDEQLTKLISTFDCFLNSSGLLIYEHRKSADINYGVKMHLVDSRNFGDTVVDFLQLIHNESEG